MRDAVYANLIANAIGWLFLIIANKLRLWLFVEYGRRDPRRWSSVLLILIFTWVALNIGIFSRYADDLPESLRKTVPILTSLVVFWFLWKDLSHYFSVGLFGADKSIKDGLDYIHSLRLCHNSLSFLGIGASKLTASDEFEKALARCSADKPARFLLSEPTSENLTQAAKRASRPVEEYKHIVLQSLKRIAQLKCERDFNVEVRFYKDTPIFRLMFIDESLCLMSYNIFGKGDGSDFPQLHLINIVGKKKEKSFYYPLQKYFEQQWNKGCEWNFQSYLQNS